MWEDHQRAGAIVQKERRTHLLNLVSKIALRVRFDRQPIVKAIGMAQRRDKRVRTNRFTADFYAAQCRSPNRGARSVHNQALVLKHAKSAPEPVRAKRYSEHGPQ